MATRLLAPSMGEGIEELTIVNWLKKEGDTIKEFEVIVELETDKVTTEIPSPVSGTLLKIMEQKDAVVKVGSTLAWIGEPGEKIDAGAPKREELQSEKAPRTISQTETPEQEPVAQPREVQQPSEYKGRISPLVKQIAEANQVDLNHVTGTGRDGRITKDDILAYLETNKSPESRAVTHSISKPVEKQPIAAEPPEGTLVPHTSIRKRIAERMVESQQTSPHVLTVMEADLIKVVAHRAANKESYAQQGVNLTLTAYFCSAIVNALKTSPEVNSSWTDDGLQHYSVINLGIATALGKDGLIVPVIKDAGSLSLLGLAKNINDLSSRAREKKLLPDEVKGGTFTLTNHGSAGSLFASPIIFQPQSAILGTGMMQKRAIILTDNTGNDAIAIRPMIYLSLVFDHRILDGESADRFLKSVKQSLENWV